MTKRVGSHQTNNGKKPKLDDDEIRWDEDLDDDALDKCFELASQVFQDAPISQRKDLSILPTYSEFKNPVGFSSSTQTNSNVLASTSKRPVFYELEAEVQKLKIQNEEKDGEISILRSKIKETNNVVHVEQQKTTNEWREKLLQTQKEAKQVKSELEFKNLEIANLKQQMSELKRLNLDATVNSTQQFIAPTPRVKVNHERTPDLVIKDYREESTHRQAIVESIYPLKSISPHNFEDLEENHVIKNTSSYKISRNTIPYLQNQQTYNESNFHHKCARIGNRKISLESVYPDVFKLVNSTSAELNDVACTEAVNKVICVTLIVLQDLNEYLIEFGSHLRAEDIKQADTNYLLEDQDPCSTGRSTKVYQNEMGIQAGKMGIQAGKILQVISQLILYNSYSADFICGDKSLKLFPNTQEYARLIPHRNGNIQNDCYLLKLLLKITKNVGKYRIANQMNGFLMSMINLLINIGILDNKNYMDELMVKRNLFCNLFNELVFVRPGSSIIQRITYLLKVGSQYKTFVQYLFGKNGKNPLQRIYSKSVLCYTEDACSFCVLGVLLQNYLLKTKKIPLEVCYNMVAFIFNTFKTSQWIHHENTDIVCQCITQLYKLEIEFVFRVLEDFIECFGKEKKQCGLSDDWTTFLRHEIVQNVLIQIQKNFELTEKYVTVYSQFKEIETVLKHEGLFNITQLNTSEELVKIAAEKFRNDF